MYKRGILAISWVLFFCTAIAGSERTFRERLRSVVLPMNSPDLYMRYKVMTSGKTTDYILKRSLQNFYTANEFEELIIKDKWSLNINHAVKIAILTKINNQESKATIGLDLLEKLDTLPLSDTSIIEKGGEVLYKFMSAGIQYQMRYNNTTQRIMQYEMSKKNRQTGKLDRIVVLINELDLKRKWQVKDFPIERYVDLSKSRPVMTDNYKKYQLVLRK